LGLRQTDNICEGGRFRSFLTNLMNGQYFQDLVYAFKLINLLERNGFAQRTFEPEDDAPHSASITYTRSDDSEYCPQNLEFYTFIFRSNGVDVLHKSIFHGGYICDSLTDGQEGRPYDFWLSFIHFLNLERE